jgi:hypothetical protein
MDLAETVKILREAGARATFYENGGLKSIAFTPKFDAPTIVLGPDGLPFVEPPKERTALDVVSEDPPQLEPDAEAAERYQDRSKFGTISRRLTAALALSCLASCAHREPRPEPMAIERPHEMSKRQVWGCHMRGGEVYRDQYGDERCSDHPQQPALFAPQHSTTCSPVGNSWVCEGT